MTARLAQLVERKALNLVVVGSGPTVGVNVNSFFLFVFLLLFVLLIDIYYTNYYYLSSQIMGKMRRAKKFALKKRILNPNDKRLKENAEKLKKKELKELSKNNVTKDLEIKEL